MAQLAIAGLGAAVGSQLGSAAIGWAVGSVVGSILFPPDMPDQEGPRISDLQIQTSEEGRSIPFVQGRMRLAGNVIWGLPLREVKEEEEVGGGPSGGGGATVTSYSYFGTFAVGLCAGPANVRKIWADKELIYDITAPEEEESDEEDEFTLDDDFQKMISDAANVELMDMLTVLDGSEDQNPDPTMELDGPQPGHRGMVVVVFDDIPLDRFGNRIPNVEVEVVVGDPEDVETEILGIPEMTFWPAGNPLLYSMRGETEGLTTERLLGDDSVSLDGLGFGVTSTQYGFPGDGMGYKGSGFEESFEEARQSINQRAYNVQTDGGAEYVEPSYLVGIGLSDPGVAFHPPATITVDKELTRVALRLHWVPYEPSHPEKIRNADSPETCFMFRGPEDVDSILYDPGSFHGDGEYILSVPGTGFPKGFFFVNNCSIGTGWDPEDHRGLGRTVGGTMSLARKPVCPGGCEPRDDPCTGYSRYAVGQTGRYGSSGSYCRTCDGNIVYNHPSEIVEGSFRQVRSTLIIEENGSVYDNRITSWFGPGQDHNYHSWQYSKNAPPPIMREDDERNTEAWWQENWGISKDDTVTVTEACRRLVETRQISDTLPSLATVVTAICGEVGIGPDLIDVADLESTTVTGFVQTRQSSARRAIEELQKAYWFDVVDGGEQLLFLSRGKDAVATLTEGELGTHMDGSNPPATLTEKRLMEAELPSRVDFKYIASDANYQAGAQRAEIVNVNTDNAQTLTVAVVFSADEARQRADQILKTAWLERTSFTLSLPPPRSGLLPADPIMLPDGRRIRLTQVTWASMLIEVQGVLEATAAYQSSVEGVAAPDDGQIIKDPGATSFMMIDAPLLRDADNYPGVYAVLGSPSSDWPGGTLLISSGGSNYTELGTTSRSATMSTVINAVGSGSTTVWDHENTLSVELSSGTLSSAASRLAVYNGANVAAFGQAGRWEYVQWLTAVEESDGSWTLSHLLRGRFGTEYAVDQHKRDDRFAVVTQSTALRFRDTLALSGVERQVKAVTIGATVTDSLGRSFTNTQAGLKPLSPVHIRGRRTLSSSVAWRYVRLRMWDSQDRTQADVYEWEVIAGSGGNDVLQSLGFKDDGRWNAVSSIYDDDVSTRGFTEFWKNSPSVESADVHKRVVAWGFGSSTQTFGEVRLHHHSSADEAGVPKTLTIEACSSTDDDCYSAVNDGDISTDADWVVWDGRYDLSLSDFGPGDTLIMTGGHHVQIEWTRRSRIGVGWTWDNGLEVPLGEDQELYDVEIIDDEFGTVVRSWTDLGVTSVTYTMEMQRDDFGGVLKEGQLHVKIYQKSAEVGRGFVGEAYI